MFKIYFKQAIQLLKQNPFISIISILGTALAIMMIMVIIVSDSIHNISVKPEVNRDRSFYTHSYVAWDTIKGGGWSGPLKYKDVRDYIYTMQVPEAVTAFEFVLNKRRQSTVQREGVKELHKISHLRFVDNAFWRVYAFDFVQGVPFTQEEFESGVRRAVITQSMARRLFKGDHAVGQNMLIDNVPYNVAGVVADVSQVFSMAYGEVYAPYTTKQEYDRSAIEYMIVMLAKNPKADYPRMVEEFRSMERKYEAIHPNMRFKLSLLPHAYFEDAAKVGNFYGTTDMNSLHLVNQLRTWLLFAMLLLVPAMNLSGFSVSRMKKRTEEIGIRKAFGARTGTVLFQVLYENIITSFIGGIIGLILSYAAVILLKGWILGVNSESVIPLRALVSPSVFLAVIGLCILLGIMSSGIPALRAARKNIVKSIAKNDKG